MPENAFRLLIADDEYWVRQSIASLIDWERHGFLLLPPAEDGEDAWAKIEADKPDIALLDIDMPFVSGIELTRRIRGRYPDMAVIVLSGYSEFGYVREAMMNGAVDYLLKPAERDKLLAALSLATAQLIKRREEGERLAALREQSELAASMLQDLELSELLHEAAEGKREPGARVLTHGLLFASYHLAQIRMPALRLDPQGIRELKGDIAAAFCAKNKLVFHDATRRGAFYLVAEIEPEALMADSQRLLDRLQAPVSIELSRRKTSFRQLKSAYDELRQLRLVQPYAAERRVIAAWETSHAPVRSRVSARQRRELEMALASRSRARFRQVVERDIGLRAGMEAGWLRIELLHALSAIGHILRGQSMRETNASQAAAMDELMELMLVAADREDTPEVLSILEEMLSEALGAPDDASASEGMRLTIRQVREYIAENYADELSLSLLASRFAVDDAHLSRTFKQLTGENLMLCIARTRIEHARALIERGEWSLSEVASMTGYDDYAYFNRVFRKITGQSPSAYREECTR